MTKIPQPTLFKHVDLRERLNGIANEIAVFAREIREVRSGTEKQLEKGLEHVSSNLAKARALLKIRHLRDEYFGNVILGEPSWNIILDLYAANIEGKKISVSSACLASAASATTGLRHLEALVARGLILRVADEQDRRRIFVELATETKVTLEEFMRRLTV